MDYQIARLSTRDLWRIFYAAVFEWNQDKAPRMAAALAFYTLFSMTPIVIIATAIAGAFFGRDAAVKEVLEQGRFLIGDEGAKAIQLLIENAPRTQASTPAMIIGLATMFFAATGAFTELKDSLNTIWEVQPRPGLGLFEMVRDRFLSFAMVLVIGFLLLVSLVASAIISVMGRYLASRMEGWVYMLEAGSLVVSFAVITVLFALIYKVLPDAKVAWKDVWLGAAVTAILFGIGKHLFGLYLGHSTIGSSYGAAGSLVVVTLWTYYSALILLFGAEMSQVQAGLRGARLEPAPKAVHVTEHARLQQGIPRIDDVEQAAREADAAAAHADSSKDPAQKQPPSSGSPPGKD